MTLPKKAEKPEPRSEEEFLEQCPRIEVKTYGHEGLLPVRPKDCYHGGDVSCISSSGNSICGGYEGEEIIDGKRFVICGQS